MKSAPIKLLLTKDVSAALATLLRTALDLSEGGHVVDHLPMNPWGDVQEFRRLVYLPLHGEASPTHVPSAATEVSLESREVGSVRDVVDALAESISGGNPWVALTKPEQDAVKRVVAQLALDE